MRCRIIANSNGAKAIRGGHPFIYANSIDNIINGPAQDVVEVVDGTGSFLGIALYSPSSLIRARVLQGAVQNENVHDFIADRVGEAVALRERLFGGERSNTNMERLINSEGDHLPGLIGMAIICACASSISFIIISGSVWDSIGSSIHHQTHEIIARLCD
jgi:23S rRNA (cytosine1962-C5)-methyltransferase